MVSLEMMELRLEVEDEFGLKIKIPTESPADIKLSKTYWREPRKIKNLTSTDAYKKTPRGAKGSNKLYIKMTELTQAASY